MTKLTGAALDRVVANALGLKSVHDCEKWVGLTDEDKKEYIAQDFGGSRTDAMDWTEKRLKEKNT